MEQNNLSLAARSRRHEGSAVLQSGPAALGKFDRGLRQHLARHGDLIGNGKTLIGRTLGERGQALRFRPGKRATHQPLATAQQNRQQIVISR